ncbi:protein peste-like [Uranotaenia lowii]|uniref:protein peste-like n=1 Tax=Uranotaenia lowii TaxID=190385 RepID=UPI002478D998|nr:protein peste-like [Uranotaenia lowii]
MPESKSCSGLYSIVIMPSVIAFGGSKNQKVRATWIAGTLLILFGVFFTAFWSDILDVLVRKGKAINPTSEAFAIWRQPPFHLNWEITLFNWTNAHEFLANRSTKPVFREIGPFAYLEHPSKEDIEFNPSNGTVSYRLRSRYKLDEANCQVSLNSTINSINAVALTAANQARYWGFAAQKAISIALQSYHQGVFVTKQASELLFDGYREPMLKRGKEILSMMGSSIPLEDRFSWFQIFNDTSETCGYFNMDLGNEDPDHYAMVKNWNYKAHADAADEECGKFRGFTGEIFPTRLRKDVPLKIFTAEMCRMVMFEFEREEEVHGLTGYRFVGTGRSIDNGSLYAENQCNHGGEFMPSGVINATECRYGAPFYVSFPHFYMGDSFYHDQMGGMNPEKERHQFYLIIEPITGLVLKAAVRFQINVLLQPYPGIELYENSPRSYVPVLWFSRNFQLSQPEIQKLKMLTMVAQLGYGAGFTVLGLGIILALVAYRTSAGMSSQSHILLKTAAFPKGHYEPVKS